MDFENRNQLKKQELVVLLLALMNVVYQLLFYNTLGFHRDELLYFSLGEHLDFGFQSVPPLIGLLAFVSAKIFGYTLFAAKIFPAMASGAIVYISSLVVKEFKGGFFAEILTVLALAGSILFGRVFSLFQPVVFDILFWTLSFYFIVRYINSNHEKYILYLGIASGFGILNKYNILFLIVAIFLVVPFTKYRRLFRSKSSYFSLLLAFVIVLPNLVWQIAHHFPVVSHLAELRNSQLVHVRPARFLTDQLIMILPATLLAFPGLAFLFVSRRLKKFRLTASVSFVVLLLYLLLQGKNYYAAGIYPFLIAAGAVLFEIFMRPLFIRILFVAVLVGLEWVVLPIGKPIYGPDKLVRYFDKVQSLTGDNSARRFEDETYHQLPQDYADMLGWTELAEITNRAWLQVQDKNSSIIFCENYGEAGAIAILGKNYKLPEPLSFNDAFRYWIPQSFNPEIKTLIYINSEPGDDIKNLFADIQEIGKINNPLARECGCGVYLCRNPQSSFNQFWAERVKKVNEEQ